MNSTNLKIKLDILSERGQIAVTWTETERRKDFLRFDLIRKKASIPAHYFDGKCVYSGTDNEYHDSDIKNGVIYYYRLFVVINSGENYNTDYLTDARCIVKSIAFGANIVSYGEKLYHTLPDQVLADDMRAEQNYPLKRFFRLLLSEFDKLEVINSSILDQLDVETCDEEFLPYHARWLGLEYDQNFGVDINRLLLGTWKEIQPYQGTETGVRYLLQKVFKSEVKIKVTDYVSLTVIAPDVGNIGYWMMNHVDKVIKIIKRFLALRTKWDLTIQPGPIIENFDKDRLDDWYLDFIWCLPEEEFYQNVDPGFNSEQFLLSHSLFFSERAPNTIIDEYLDILKIYEKEDEVYSLDAPACFNAHKFLLSHTLHFAKRLRDMDDLIDKIIMEFAERYTYMVKQEKHLDIAYALDYEEYDKRVTFANDQKLLSSTMYFATGDCNDFPPMDELEDKGITTDSDRYYIVMPGLMFCDNKITYSAFQGLSTINPPDEMFDNITTSDYDKYIVDEEEQLHDYLTAPDTDRYDKRATLSDDEKLLSSTMFFATADDYPPDDELLDIAITQDADRYYIVMPGLMFCDNKITYSAMQGESTVSPPDEMALDIVTDVSNDSFDISTIDDSFDSIHLWDVKTDTYDISKCKDDLLDIFHYTRPVGLFASDDAFLSVSMFLCDNLV